MSELSVTKITDRVGTGKVNFSQGFKVAGTLDTTLAPTRTEGNTEPATPANGDTWYDTDNDTYDVYINDEWKRFLGAGGGVVVWTVALSNVSYDSVSFSFANETDYPYDLIFNADGTKMYVAGLLTGYVFQYSLSTAYDISTLSYDNVSFTPDAQGTWPICTRFNSDGTKMYIISFTSKDVFQYSLSTAFDIGTATYDSVSFDFSSQGQPFCMNFNADGTKMYMLENTNDKVHQYSLSTGFDLSTTSYDNVNFSVTSQDTGPTAFFLNPEGTKMYVIGTNSDTVHQYSLSTGFDLSTASYDSVSFGVALQEIAANTVIFNADGTKMYIAGESNDNVYQYSTGL